MTEKENVFYQKVAEEQKKYRDWLLNQSSEDVLHHAYEYAMREDILMRLETLTLTEEQIDVLLSVRDPLENIYKMFDKIETDHMDTIGYCIENFADALLKNQEETKVMPIYKHSMAYAIEHGEENQYMKSFQANVLCKEEIEITVAEQYQNNQLREDVLVALLEKFGLERIVYVTANTIQQLDYDGRISQRTKAWAKDIPVMDDMDHWGQKRCLAFKVDHVHPGIFNLFAEHIQQEQRKQKRGKQKARKKVEVSL